MNQFSPLHLMRSRTFWLALMAVALGVLIVFLALSYPHALEGEDNQLRLVHGILVLTFVGASVIAHRKFKARTVARDIVLWLGVALVVLLGYSYRHEIEHTKDRLIADILPHHGQEMTGRVMRFAAMENGHFVVNATIEGVPVQLLVDTGASDVVLSAEDAVRIGVAVNDLSYNKVYNTANGQVKGARLTLNSIRIGSIEVQRVAASVTKGRMQGSLLGMSFLSRLQSFRIENGALLLIP